MSKTPRRSKKAPSVFTLRELGYLEVATRLRWEALLDQVLLDPSDKDARRMKKLWMALNTKICKQMENYPND